MQVYNTPLIVLWISDYKRRVVTPSPLQYSPKGNPMPAKKAAAKMAPAKASKSGAKDLKTQKTVKGGPAFMKLGDIKGESR